MASAPAWKVYSSDGKYLASCKYASDAAALVALHGEGATIRWLHRTTLWTEGHEEQSAADSYDYVDDVVHRRLVAHTPANRALQPQS